MAADEIISEEYFESLEIKKSPISLKLFLQLPCKNDSTLHSSHLINANLYYYDLLH